MLVFFKKELSEKDNSPQIILFSFHTFLPIQRFFSSPVELMIIIPTLT